MTLNNMTAGNLQCALNNLTDIRNEGFVNVTEVKTAFNGSTFRITFYFNNPDRTKMLQTNSQTSNMTTNVTITRLQKGIHIYLAFSYNLLDSNYSSLRIPLSLKGLL